MGYTRQQKERGENGLRTHLCYEGFLLCLDLKDAVLDGVLGDELKHTDAGEWLASGSLRDLGREDDETHGFVWPIRLTRSIACCSIAGCHQLRRHARLMMNVRQERGQEN